jgi:hypothetical protein
MIFARDCAACSVRQAAMDDNVLGICNPTCPACNKEINLKTAKIDFYKDFIEVECAYCKYEIAIYSPGELTHV